MKHPSVIFALITTLLLALFVVGRDHLFAQSGASQPSLMQANSQLRVPQQPNFGPHLSVPIQTYVQTGKNVVLSVSLSAPGFAIASTVFSINYDPQCLQFNPDDANGDGLPDGVTMNPGPQFTSQVSHNLNDEDGELDFIIADYRPPLAALPSGGILTLIEFQSTCAPGPSGVHITPIDFATSPSASFGNSVGRSVAGAVSGGDIVITTDEVRGTPVPTRTPAPTSTPRPTATPDPEKTENELADIFATATAVSATATALVAPSGTPPSTPVATLNNGPLISFPNSLSTLEDTAVDIDLAANGFIPLHILSSVVIVEQPLFGHAQLKKDSIISYMPIHNYVGLDIFSFQFRDEKEQIQTWQIFLRILPVNDPPVLLDVPTRLSGGAGDVITYAITAEDLDSAADRLIFTGINLPIGLAINRSTGEISGTLEAGNGQEYVAMITVSDGELSHSRLFKWQVDGIPRVITDQLYLPLITAK